MNFRKKLAALAIATATFATDGLAAEPQGTAFTYQGELRQNNVPVSGNTDLVFELFDAPIDGNPIGAPLAFVSSSGNPVLVVDGVFTVALDFGATAFNQPISMERYLEITVNGNALSPRTKIENAPYALQARTAEMSFAVGDQSVGLSQIKVDQVQRRVTGACADTQFMQRIFVDGTVTCGNVSAGSVTRIDAGFGLVGGPITTSGTLAVDPAVVQQRITGSCPAGSYMRAVNDDGSVQCAPVSTRTAFVYAVGTPQQNGAALLSTATSLRNSPDRWLIKVDAGDFDIGDASLVLAHGPDVELTPGNSLQGAGRDVTRIHVNASATSSHEAGLIAHDGVFSDLSVESVNDIPSSSFAAVRLFGSSTIERADILASGSPTSRHIGIDITGGSPLAPTIIRDVSVHAFASGSTLSIGINNPSGLGELDAFPLRIIDSEIVATDGAALGHRNRPLYYGVYPVTTIDRSRLEGRYWSYQFYGSDYGLTPVVEVTHSTLSMTSNANAPRRVNATCAATTWFYGLTPRFIAGGLCQDP